jgi:SAM-dependent methyltransferase
MRRLYSPSGEFGTELLWHQTECGGYSADLGLWERLATESGDPVLDLGAGAGRVAVHLATRGHRVHAVDSDPELLEAVDAGARAGSLPITTEVADVRGLSHEPGFPLVIAPMQLLHLLGGAEGRRRALRSISSLLLPGGLFAAALLDDREPISSGTADPLPDVRERDSWVHSSLPLEVRVEPDGILIRRLRQLVSPAGELTEREHEIWLDHLPPGRLEAEAASFGLIAEERVLLPETAEHVSSIVVLLRQAEQEQGTP